MKNSLCPIWMMYMTKTAERRCKEISKLNITNRNFHLLCKLGSHKQIEDALIFLQIDPRFNYSKSLISASEGGKINNVRVLIKDNRVNPTSLSYSAIGEAIKGNQSKMFYLLKAHILHYLRENNIPPSSFYFSFLIKICKYERTDMLEVTHQEIIDSGIHADPFIFLIHIFAKYDKSKQHFLDTLIRNYELPYDDVLISASNGTIEGLEYSVELFVTSNTHIHQDILDECLEDSIRNVLPDNVELLLKLSNNPILSDDSFQYIKIDDDDGDIFKRNKEEKISDFRRMSDILFNSKSKINRYTKRLIHYLINLSEKHTLLYKILRPYFFTSDGEYIMLKIIKNENDFFKDKFQFLANNFAF